MRLLRRTALVLTIAIVFGFAIAAGWYLVSHLERLPGEEETTRRPMAPEAPPDLEKVREPFLDALAAYRKGDYTAAAQQLESFGFGSRAVEEYRLYYLARSLEEAHDPAGARLTLARLCAGRPEAIVGDDAGLRLAALYGGLGDWTNGSHTFDAVAAGTDAPATAAAARWGAIEAHFNLGDPGAALEDALAIVTRSPDAPQAGPASELARALVGAAEPQPLPLSFGERLERAVRRLGDRNAAAALDELNALLPSAPGSLLPAVMLNRGLALNQLGRYGDSNTVLEPLASGAYSIAIPALYTSAANYRSLAASVDPTVTKIVFIRRRAGTMHVKRGSGANAKIVLRPRYASVRKTLHFVDPAKKAKKAEYTRLQLERLRDLLQLHQTAIPLRLEALQTLIAVAESRGQDSIERDLVREVVKLDRHADPGLQHFWDLGWAAYSRGDLASAIPLFRFIGDTYANPNVKRQAQYWYARSVERAGDLLRAAEVYRQLASAPYEDLYSLEAEQHGATRGEASARPAEARPDWSEIAEKIMPHELRLAYELTALSDFADAQREIERNVTQANRHYADALRAQKLNEDGNFAAMYSTLRRAFPLLATVEQDSVPPYFIRMYYPRKFEQAIARNAEKTGVDPYLVMALILQESYYDPTARSRAGAVGLMQLMPATGKELGRRLHGVFSITHLEDPETNIELGTYHLQHLLALFNGNPQLVAASYNAGQGNVLRWRRAARGKPMDEFLESIPFPETRNYVKRVTLLRSTYARMAR